MPKFGFGWRKDKYIPEKIHPLHKPKLVKIPSIFTLIQWLCEQIDQGTKGSCVGAGLTGAATSTAIRLNVFIEKFSIWWIYNGARFLEGTLTQDAGAEPSDAYIFIKEYLGYLLNRYWPYDPYGPFDMTAPPSSLKPCAAIYPLDIDVTRVDNGIDGIKSALAEGNFVTFGGPWFDKWMDPGPSGILPIPKTSWSVGGGHEHFYFGYNDNTGLFDGRNSWVNPDGTPWGDNGNYHMPYESIDVCKALGGYDTHYITVKWNSVPVPPPAPGPGPTPPPPTPGPCSIARTYAGLGNFVAGRIFGCKTRLSIK